MDGSSILTLKYWGIKQTTTKMNICRCPSIRAAPRVSLMLALAQGHTVHSADGYDDAAA
jgi:hypothetical protein